MLIVRNAVCEGQTRTLGHIKYTSKYQLDVREVRGDLTQQEGWQMNSKELNRGT